MRPGLISTQALHERLPHVRVLDASWYLPAMGRDARAEFAAQRVPGARFFDLDAASDPASPLPHMLPPPAHFEATARALGISDDDAVVVYDGSGANLSAARCWWMFRAFGHDDVRVLDGGFPAWAREARPVDRGPAGTVPPGRFTARPRANLVRSLDEMRALVATRAVQVADTRSGPRFMGEAAEPRPGVRAGHIPGSRNVPYAALVDADGRLLGDAALGATFAAAGVRPDAPLVASCGSGVSACALVLALHALGQDDVTLYDGAWSEWGARDDTPIETGPAR
jgi:thiosulfate/3-mercaptopyruvate sulfurtransferase